MRSMRYGGLLTESSSGEWTLDSRGTLALLGSGETSSQGRKIHDYLMSRVGEVPVRVAMLETPAGFQPNVDAVYEKIGEFLEKSLQNFKPQVKYIRALKKNSPYSPDNEKIIQGMLGAHYVFSGPGSPTYAARNLRGTAAARCLAEALTSGATIVLSSAAAMSAGSHVLRVYEIFKAGAELGWDRGLDLMREAGLGIDPVIVSHWNNAEGGAGLDTSRCYMGEERFARLLDMLPQGVPVLGIDEHTACIFEPGSERVRVMGAGRATILRGGDTLVVPAGEDFAIQLLQSRNVEAVSA
jgi:hypothetical protein